MGLLDVLMKVFTTRPAPAPTGRRVELVGVDLETEPPEWVMPTYAGKAICDHVETVRSLKRQGRLDEALALAKGCMDAMTAVALENPGNVMPFYVTQVMIIQHKMKDYAGEIDTLVSWMGHGLPQPEAWDVEIRKRLAKARELLAREQGEDATAFHDEGRTLVQREKELKGSDASAPVVHTGASRFTGQPAGRRRRRTSSGEKKEWEAPREVLAQSEFVAVDFETANHASGASACQIALVKIRDGRVIDTFATLLRPPTELMDFEFTYVHGISAHDVADAPNWSQVAGEVEEFVAGLPVYAHNAPFDARVWRDLDEYFGLATKPPRFYCTVATAKQFVDLPNFQLPTVTQALVPGFTLTHHDAASDAEACGLIVAALRDLARS